MLSSGVWYVRIDVRWAVLWSVIVLVLYTSAHYGVHCQTCHLYGYLLCWMSFLDMVFFLDRLHYWSVWQDWCEVCSCVIRYCSYQFIFRCPIGYWSASSHWIWGYVIVLCNQLFLLRWICAGTFGNTVLCSTLIIIITLDWGYGMTLYNVFFC